jgi:hypothetical protein
MSLNDERIGGPDLQWATIPFDEAGWHDVHIHGIAAVPDRFELYLDIDYLLDWKCPRCGPGPARFRVAPATVRFEDVSSVELALESPQGTVAIRELERITISNRDVQVWRWMFHCHQGSLSFESTGFKVLIRKQPITTELQHLTAQQRGLPFSW